MATTRAGATKRKPADDPAGNGDAKLDERALEDLLQAMQRTVDGDFSTKLRARRTDIVGDLQRAFNALQDRNAAMSRELARVGRVVGREGRMTERASLVNVEGEWAESIDSEVARSGYFGSPGELDPSLKETEYLPTRVFDRIAEWFGVAREQVGWDFELMVDCHGRLNLANSVRLADVLAPFNLLFLEEPLPPETPQEYAQLRARSRVPIAAGERLVTIYDVRPYLEQGALDVLQCDVVNCGGFSGAKRNTTYTYYVRSTDAAGNTSQAGPFTYRH